MVGLVIVSHSQKLAEGTAELARMMAPDAPLAAAGGLDDGGFGTSFEKIAVAVDSVYSDDGAVILMDMGSAVMTAEMVLESMEERKLKLLDCPVVEGAVLAAVEAQMGTPLEEIEQKVAETRTMRKISE